MSYVQFVMSDRNEEFTASLHVLSNRNGVCFCVQKLT
jgi:hypothetical protein